MLLFSSHTHECKTVLWIGRFYVSTRDKRAETSWKTSGFSWGNFVRTLYLETFFMELIYFIDLVNFRNTLSRLKAIVQVQTGMKVMHVKTWLDRRRHVFFVQYLVGVKELSLPSCRDRNWIDSSCEVLSSREFFHSPFSMQNASSILFRDSIARQTTNQFVWK